MVDNISFLILLNSAALLFNYLYKYLSNKMFFDARSGKAERLRILACQIFHLP